jgi:hypothetical protein
MELRVKDDLLWGVRAIADEIGQSERQVYYQLENGLLPGGKSGQTWVASRKALQTHFEKLTTSFHQKESEEKAAASG